MKTPLDHAGNAHLLSLARNFRSAMLASYSEQISDIGALSSAVESDRVTSVVDLQLPTVSRLQQVMQPLSSK